MRERSEAGHYIFDLSLLVRRVIWADLDNGEWHQWLRQRLSERYQITIQGAEGHLRSWSQRNDALLLRCESAAGLAVIVPDLVTSRKTVRELFVFTPNRETGWHKPIVRLFREFQIWAASLGAACVEITTDIATGNLMDLVGPKEETRLWLPSQRQ